MATPNPSIHEEPVYIPKAKGRFSPGTFVELTNGSVAMILQTSGLGILESDAASCHGDTPESYHPRKVRVALLSPFADRDFTIDRTPNLAPDCRYVPELTTTANVSVISTHTIDRICFVFHPSMPGLKLVCIQGMSAVYVCRYDHTGAEINPESWHPFPSAYEGYKVYCSICIPGTVWLAVSTIQQAFRKILGRSSENQGMYPKGRINLLLPADAWSYIVGKIDGRIPIRDLNRSTAKRILGSGMILCTERDRRPSNLYRFETVNDIRRTRNDCATNICIPGSLALTQHLNSLVRERSACKVHRT
jgi:hypothetical protein